MLYTLGFLVSIEFSFGADSSRFKVSETCFRITRNMSKQVVDLDEFYFQLAVIPSCGRDIIDLDMPLALVTRSKLKFVSPFKFKLIFTSQKSYAY